MENLRESIFTINNSQQFSSVALQVFHYQFANNPVYKRYCELMHSTPETLTDISSIPFLPIELYKSAKVYCDNSEPEIVFTSSGTTGQITSSHYVKDLQIYEESFLSSFKIFYGNPEDYCFLFLLPSYLERSGSSLVYMAKTLIEKSKQKGSGFYLHNLDELKLKLQELKKSGQRTILFGVTYALLDLADLNVTLNENFIVMETGGMKGKRKELLKEELHATLKEKFGVNKIHSEYGMTELLSQAYSKGDGIFECPPWMKVMIRDPYDPRATMAINKSGGINVIDLANLHSCSFIATEDLGKMLAENRFEISGRLDDADLRGCNLMLD